MIFMSRLRPNSRSGRIEALFTFLMAMLAVTLCFAIPSSAKSVQAGRVVIETVHGVSLEKTVTGESADRAVAIYLPPSYDSGKKRYPVVYILHGIGGTEKDWVEDKDPWRTIQGVMDRGIAAGRFKEMIVVMPNQFTNRYGSYYTNSSVTGRWEDFTTSDLVRFVDSRFRTLARSESRGIAGHSMGGYGALKLAMKNPEVYSVTYGMNPSLVAWSADLTALNPAFIQATNAKTYDDIRPPSYAAGIVTVAQAFSPNPNNPPFYVDLPYKEVGGRVVPSEPGFSKWEANSLANMVVSNRANLMRLRGIKFDSGYQDAFLYIPPNSRAFSQRLIDNGIEHIFEEYNGDHNNRLWGREGRIYNEVFPYFSSLLEFD